MAFIQPRHVAEIMASWVGLEVVSCTQVQSLWAGYGQICAVQAKVSSKDAAGNHAEATRSLILKLISPPQSRADEGHMRKIFSYQVEQHFYTSIAPQLNQQVAVASCLASTNNMDGKPNAELLQGLTATLMTDLMLDFPVPGESRSLLNNRQVYASLEWLARFHGQSWHLLPNSFEDFVLPPLEEVVRRQRNPAQAGNKLWLNGGYTYLATRQSEYRALAQKQFYEWTAAFCTPLQGQPFSVAELAAKFLTPQGRPFETYIHGDVKSENLFTTRAGDKVAFFDFQYAGLGLGVCDLAKLFTCSVPLSMLTNKSPTPHELEMDEGEKMLLEYYREILLPYYPENWGDSKYDWELFVLHWHTALVDWCRFQASWGFWGNTEWLEARVRWILKDESWRDWLQGSSSGAASM